MKIKFVYIGVFAMAFAAVTSAIFYMNMRYKNIFKFDFTPEMVATDSLAVQQQPFGGSVNNGANTHIADSLSASSMDSLYANAAAPPPVKQVDSLQLLKDKIAFLNNELSAKEQELASIKTESAAKRDSTYQDWKKQTVKLYETMDSKKAAKILATYTDDVARDILYSLKKKKAAQILAELNVETATRLTRAN
jgi:flagellar motility protein MotE (MotC chaperone)